MKFEHIGIRTYDVDELADWYERVLGFKTTSTSENAGVGGCIKKHRFIENYGLMLDIFSDGVDNEKVANGDQHIEHLGFKTNSIEADYDNLIANKVYIYEDRTNLTEGGCQNIYCRDINNNSIHFVQNDTDAHKK